MEPSVVGMTWADITTGITNATSLVGDALNVMTSNPGLMAVFAGGLMAVGFRIFRKAKRAAK